MSDHRWDNATTDACGCVFCAGPTTGTIRVGNEDWYVCGSDECSVRLNKLRAYLKRMREQQNTAQVG